jgi:hypothetical protein
MSVHPSKTWNIAQLLKALEEKYHEQGLTRYWAEERPLIDARLAALRDKLAARYVEPIVRGVGGSGVVLRLTDEDLAKGLIVIDFFGL